MVEYDLIDLAGGGNSSDYEDFFYSAVSGFDADYAAVQTSQGPETTFNNDNAYSIYNQTTIPDLEDGSHDVLTTVLLAIVFAVGLIGNFLVIFVILVLAEYKRVLTHWYVLQLAIADTIFLLTIPFRIAEEMQSNWILPQWMCKAKETMFFLNYYASTCFLVLMTIDRYIAICHRFSRTLHKFRNRSQTYMITAVVWFVSLMICIPAMMYSSVVGTPKSCKCEFLVADQINDTINGRCGDVSKDDANNISFNKTEETSLPACHYKYRSNIFKGFLYFNFIGMFIIPFIIMSVCYTKIALKLKSTEVKSYQASEPTDQSPFGTPVCRENRSKSIASIKDNKNRNRVTMMCLCLVVLFLCCWLPFHAVHLAKLRGIEEDEKYCEWVFHLTFIIAYFSVSSHSALNPCLYNFIGEKSENRLKSAASSVRKSIQRRSTISSTSVRYQSSNRSTSSQTVHRVGTTGISLKNGVNNLHDTISLENEAHGNSTRREVVLIRQASISKAPE